MDFEAVVHMVLPLVTGQGMRGEWRKQEVVFELPGEFSRKICVGFWNEKANEAGALRVGDRVAVSVNIESRERNGRWFTEVRGWKMSRIEMQPIIGNNAYGQQQQYGGGYGQPQQGGYGQAQQQYGGYQQPQSSYQQPMGGYSQPQSAPQATTSMQDAPVDDLPF